MNTPSEAPRIRLETIEEAARNLEKMLSLFDGTASPARFTNREDGSALFMMSKIAADELAHRIGELRRALADAPAGDGESEAEKIAMVDRAITEAEAKWRSDKDKDSIRARILADIAARQPYLNNHFEANRDMAVGAIGALEALLTAIEPWLEHRFDLPPLPPPPAEKG